MVADLKKLTVPSALVAEPDIQTAGTIAFTEGPAVDAEGNLFFSDIANNPCLRRPRPSDALHRGREERLFNPSQGVWSPRLSRSQRLGALVHTPNAQRHTTSAAGASMRRARRNEPELLAYPCERP